MRLKTVQLQRFDSVPIFNVVEFPINVTATQIMHVPETLSTCIFRFWTKGI